MFEVESLLPSFHWLPGLMPTNVLRRPDIANAFILERAGAAWLIDTGVGPEFRRALSRFFAGRRYDAVTLVNTHVHVDHVGNNDILNSIDAGEKTHVIHPAGVPYLNPYEWMKGEANLAARRYSPFNFDVYPLSLIAAVGRACERIAPGAAYGALARVSLRKFEPIRSRTPHLAPLSPADRMTLHVGPRAFQGWRTGDLLLLDDGGHSPDSISVYDPRERLLLLGDLTYPYNPLWPSGTYGRMIQNLQAYRTVVAEGAVAVLADGHNHRLFRGVEEILPLLDSLIATHEQRRTAIAHVAAERGFGSLESIRRALIARHPEFAQLAREREFPRALCFTRAMIAVALNEAQLGIAQAQRPTAAPDSRAAGRDGW